MEQHFTTEGAVSFHTVRADHSKDALKQVVDEYEENGRKLDDVSIIHRESAFRTDNLYVVRAYADT